jgi:hypothetical protein
MCLQMNSFDALKIQEGYSRARGMPNVLGIALNAL